MPNRRFAIALAASLADLGLEHACISPGSRNTPLIAGFGAEDRIRKWPVLDERSAGFFALGLARVSGVPVVLACTSGTAATEYHPAVVEADQSDIPLLVLTADRPEELRGLGAPQTIDQISLYGTAVRMFADAPAPDDTTPAEAAGQIAFDIWAHAVTSPPGPVHLNLPFREPLLNPIEPVTPNRLDPLEPTETEVVDLSRIASALTARRGLIVAGRCNDRGFPDACARLATVAGFPIIADPLSGLRFGDHSLDNVLAYGDHLAAGGALDLLAPEVVLRFGPVPTSKPTWHWLEEHPGTPQILIDTRSRDATNSAATILEIDPTDAAGSLADSITGAAPDGWFESWLELDRRVTEHLARLEFPSEPAVARIVTGAAPAGSALTLGSSMPIRDVDAFAGKGPQDIRLFGNRGANGIDGIVSTALGVAAAGLNSIVLLGDVSLFYDLNALGTAAQLGLPVTVVVVNNNGGGIFSFLPQANHAILSPDLFETYLATPHGTDFVPLALAFGIEAHDVSDPDELRRLVATPAEKPRLIQVRTDRGENLQLHRRIGDSVRELIR
jgi:2-succinyl-5-enolpyruvyl-6-hydroxy-3-cyclohexene-1-carboxylate synthase